MNLLTVCRQGPFCSPWYGPNAWRVIRSIHIYWMSKVEMIHPSNTRHLFVLRDMWDFMDSEVTRWSSRKDCLRYFYWNLRISNYSIGPFQRGPWSEWPGPLSTWPCHCLRPWGQIHAWGLKWLSWLFSVLCWNELNECHPFKGPLGRLCPHSTWVTTLLDHFSGKCPQNEAKATWGHLFHCLRIMPYFNKSKEKNPGKQVFITVSPKLDSRFVHSFVCLFVFEWFP